MSKNNKIIKNCIDLYLDKIIKLYKNIKKINPNHFILYFVSNDLNLKNYKKIIKDNKIFYINNTNNKYNYYFSFNKSNKYLLFSLVFTYKNNIKLNIFTIKTRIFNINETNKQFLYSDIYNLKIKNIDKTLKHIQLKLAEILAEYINIILVLVED